MPFLVLLVGLLCPDGRVHVLEPAPSFGVAYVPRVAERVEAEGLEVTAAKGRGRGGRRVGGLVAVGQAMLESGNFRICILAKCIISREAVNHHRALMLEPEINQDVIRFKMCACSLKNDFGRPSLYVQTLQDFDAKMSILFLKAMVSKGEQRRSP